MARPTWFSDFLIVMVFAVILAILSVVNIRVLHQVYEQTERLQTVNQFVDCLDPTTPCGMKVAENQAAEREWLTDTMRNQAVCTLLTSRNLPDVEDMSELERVYNECVTSRVKEPPVVIESPVVEEKKEKKN